MEGPSLDLLFDETDFTLHGLSGILPRTAIFLFNEKERLKKQFGKELGLEISAIEIYCDKLRDLFSEDTKTQGLGVDLKVDPQTKKVFV